MHTGRINVIRFAYQLMTCFLIRRYASHKKNTQNQHHAKGSFMPAHSRTGDKTTALSFRVTAAERAELDRCAADAALSTGEYIRRAALGRTITHRADIQAVAQLRSFGGLLKHLHINGVGNDAEINAMLDDIRAVLKGMQ